MHTETHFLPVKTASTLEQLFSASQNVPVLLFNHDPWCPISRAIYEKMQPFGGDIPLVDVSVETGLTRDIAERTGVKHESPQIILLRHGHAVWSASHFAITPEAVSQALHTCAE